MRGSCSKLTRALALLVLLSPWAPAATVAADVVTLAPELKERLVSSERLSGLALTPSTLDRRVVVVTFFASWCPPCNVEFKHLAELHATYAARGVAIVAINHFENYAGFQDNGGRLQRFIDRHDPPFSVVRGNDDIARAFGNVTRIPTLFVFAPNGRPTFQFVHHEGARKTNATMAEVRTAIETAFESVAPKRSGPGLPAIRQSGVTKP